MRDLDITEKYKGLINRKDWEIGTLKLYEDGLAAICRDGKEFYVFKESVSRCTGYVTNSGEEIFDGDLLSISGKNDEDLLEVFWDESGRVWKAGRSPLQDSGLCLLLDSCLDSVVIGHVFTHQFKFKFLKKKLQNDGKPVRL